MNANEVRKWTEGCWRTLATDADIIEDCRAKAVKLLERTKVAVFVSLDEQGLPDAKAMLVAKGSDLCCLRFSSNASSRHVGHIRQNPQATVYLFDPETFEGLMLSGAAREEPDGIWRENIWEDGYEASYSGFDDPDYYILRFDTARGNYYTGAMNVTFAMESEKG